MSHEQPSPRRFSVRARHLEAHHARRVNETTVEAAVIAYVEDFHPWEADEGQISVIVRDLDSGHEHCFRLDLETGETGPCS